MQRFIYGATLAFLFLLPLFFLPVLGSSIHLAKIILVGLYALCASAYLIHQFISNRKEKISLPLIGFFLLLPVVASLVSSSSATEVFYGLGGNIFDLGSFGIVFSASIIAVALARLVKSSRDVLNFSLAYLSGLIVMFSIQVLKTLVGAVVQLPVIFGSQVFNLFGKWNDLGMASVLILAVIFFALRTLKFEKKPKILLSIIATIAAFFLILVNFKIAFIAFLILALGLMVSEIKLGLKRKGYFILLIVSFLIIGGLYADSEWSVLNNVPNTFIGQAFGISTTEVYPNTKSTMQIVRIALADNPLFGGGENAFRDLWRIHKPLSVNQGSFFATDFQYGSGFIPTMFINQGLVGGLGYGALSVFALLLSFQVMKKAQDSAKGIQRVILESLSFSTAMLVISLYFYTPGVALYMSIWVLVGLMYGLYHHDKEKPAKRSYASVPYVLAVLVLVGALGSSFILVRQSLASFYSEQSSYTSLRGGDRQQALLKADKAMKWYKQDVYAQEISQILYTDFSQTLSATETSEVDAERLQRLLDGIELYAQAAIGINPDNAYNYYFLAELYRSLGEQGLEGAYEKSLPMYDEAIKRNPNNPVLFISRARAQAGMKQIDEAKDDLEQAIRLKPNHTEAVFLLSQLLVAEGSEEEALAGLVARAKVPPAEPIVFFQIGFIQYSLGEYEEAREALETAVSLAGEYANAMYFLGLTYDKLNRTDEALALFRKIRESNPEARELDTIISNLASGREALYQSRSVAPENNETLPIDEE